MGPTLKKRKIIDGNVSRRPFHQNIRAFAKVTKPGLQALTAKRKAAAVESAYDSDSEREHKKPTKVESKKRRREEDLEVSQSQSRSLDSRSVNIGGGLVQSDSKSHLDNARPRTPENPRKKAKLASRPTLTDTPTKGVRTFLESFVLSSPHGKRSSSPTTQCSPPSSISSILSRSTKDQIHFDEETRDLIELHNAFLNALSIHYAHNCTSSPADIRLLIPSIQRRWGKRSITVDDIQQLLGIEQFDLKPTENGNPLSLVNYGKSQICIEYASSSESAFPVESLRQRFLASIEKIVKSGESIPLAQVTVLEADQRGPSKGALRLAEIKARPTESQALQISTQYPIEASSHQSFKPDNRSQSLMERIRVKEAYAASLPVPPSAEVLARRAALMRLEEVIPVLEILTGSSSTSVASKNLYSASSSQASLDALMGPKLSGLGASLGFGPALPAKAVSFTLGNIVQHLQNSLKHPIARDEAERCVRLLAHDVTPRWVGIREVGKVVGVTFRGKVGRAEWTGRLNELIQSA